MNDKTKQQELQSAIQKREQLEKLLKERAAASERWFPLSYGQQALWFLYQIEPDTSIYNLATVLRLNGALNMDAFDRAALSLINKHPALRTAFAMRDGEPMQQVTDGQRPNLEIIDATAWTENQVKQFVPQQIHTPFDLANGPLYRIKLLRLASDDYLLIMVIHHIISDMRSIEVLSSDFFALYGAATGQTPTPTSVVSGAYREFVRWQRAFVEGEEGTRQLEYWKQQLRGDLPVLELSAIRTSVSATKGDDGCIDFTLDSEQVVALREIAKQANTRVYTVMLAAFQVLLHRYTGQLEVCVGAPAFGRTRAEFEQVVGYFVNPVVFRANLEGNPRFNVFLEQVRATVIAALAHQDYPFPTLVKQLHPHRDSQHNPFFQVMMDWQVVRNQGESADSSNSKFGGLQAKPVMVPQQEGLFDLVLDIKEIGDTLYIMLKNNAERVDVATVTALADHFQVLLAGVIADPACPVAKLPLLPDLERRLLLGDWNDTVAEYPRDRAMHQLFEAQVVLRPDAVAVSCQGQTLSYAELDQRANRLASHLQSRGVKAGSLVGVCLERGVDLLVGLLGILKAGGGYLPIDLVLPRERIEFMLEESGVTLVVTHTHLAGQLPAHESSILLDAMPSTNTDEYLPADVAPESLAYVIYTSGSTGKPKGVQVPHRAVVNFLNSMAKQPGITPQDVLVAVTTISFDIHILELFLPLAVGARVEIATRDVVTDGIRLLGLLRDSCASILQATPTTWRMLIEAGWTQPLALKALCGGEALPLDLAQQLAERCAALWNMYGPTETTVWSSTFCFAAGSPAVLVGRPIDNTRFYVLDDYLQPLPVGVAGELYIGGDGVTHGYLQRPEMTAERFIADPFSTVSAARMYRTGDRARFLMDGNVQLLGRVDHQVKLRGYRIELGEIETALAAHPDVKAAVTVVREGAGGPTLVAYTIAAGTSAPTPAQLRDFLRQTLPEYMVPTTIVWLERFPLTPNGKIDRKALPEPPRAAVESTPSSLAPEGELEVKMAKIWEELLDYEGVTIYDTFYDLGGHSLLSLKVVDRFERETGRRVGPAELVGQTLRQVIAGVEARGESSAKTTGKKQVTGLAGTIKNALSKKS